MEKAGARMARTARRIVNCTANSKSADARDIIEMKRARYAAKANAKVARTAGAMVDRRV